MFCRNDYYPGGMTMPGRDFTITGKRSRHSINGQERSDELNDNLTTALYWEYDSRIGRRWNVDPKPKTDLSSYSTFENNPVFFSDKNGDVIDIKNNGERVKYDNGKAYAYNKDGTLSKEVYNGTNKFILQTIKDLNGINKQKFGKLYLRDLSNSKNTLSILDSKDAMINNYDEKGSHTITYSQLPVNNKDGVNFNKSFIKLGHEIAHAWDWDQGKAEYMNPTKYGGLPLSEIHAVIFENYLRAMDGETDMRTAYTYKNVRYEILDNSSADYYKKFKRPLRNFEITKPLFENPTFVKPINQAVIDAMTNGIPPKPPIPRGIYDTKSKKFVNNDE